MKHLHNLRICLSFLTRLSPVSEMRDPDFSGTLAWFVPCGLVLGFFLSLPLWIMPETVSPLVSAWIVVILEVYLTRGLHWDGWADLWDAVGSNARGERFWEILKDSRIGVFGTAGIVLGISGEIILFSAGGAVWTAVVWAMILGRLVPVIQAFTGRDLPRPGMGRMFVRGSGLKLTVLACAGTALLGLFLVGAASVVTAAGILFFCLLGLQATARKQKGINGDFLGAGIIAGQITGFLSTALF